MTTGNYDSLRLIQSQFNIKNIEIEDFNQEYEAFNFECNSLTYKNRKAKKTPLKQGYFLAIWKKDQQNKNEPFSVIDSKDYLLVSIIDGKNYGYFKFPKSVLLKQKILTDNNNKGKMAFRVYPSWENNLNQTATKTQEWQVQYFIDLSSTDIF
ncbi:TPA: MepB family protein [Enterococcus faecalis]|uniref:MepB family protein n=1 Tax=Enterococcus TaxID=1350 RepID=UPI000E0842D3|nr:MepB family protein [Enterococcus durans]STQ48456.1 mepB family protein [Enterococcus durans]HAP4494889.1 MepB family protein [Enterococcus faecalis]HAP4503671.1 MepB family protein [Enterococcus faecalis]